ncbi:hypothetical protein BC829DRAFT_382484 [Chytridium lagenaria]|nr:hypothetical protein BC829DRAFT_382484 [Chytridium lagenaria]
MADPSVSPTTESRLKSQVDGMADEITRLEASVLEAAKEKEPSSSEQKQRAEGFESNVKALRLGRMGKRIRLPIDNASISVDPIFKSIDDALASDSAETLKALVKELRERLLLQHAKNKKLMFELEMECGHVNILREEEFITNRLMQRINNLKRSRSQRAPEELSQLQREKIEMEQALEQEQEFIVNRLQRQLEILRQSQPASNSAAASPAAEVNALKMRMHDLEKDYEDNALSARDVYQKCRTELVELRLKQGLPVDQLDQAYPTAILPQLVMPGSPALTGDFSTRPYGTGVATIGSLERRSRGSLVGSQHELGNWPRNSDPHNKSRSVSSTRGV